MKAWERVWERERGCVLEGGREREGRVFKVERRTTGLLYAFKAVDESGILQLAHEIHTLKRLNHDRVIKVLSVAVKPIGYVMPLATGRSLDIHLAEPAFTTNFTIQQRLQMACDIVDAVSYVSRKLSPPIDYLDPVSSFQGQL